jgi:hypothetical protein
MIIVTGHAEYEHGNNLIIKFILALHKTTYYFVHYLDKITYYFI